MDAAERLSAAHLYSVFSSKDADRWPRVQLGELLSTPLKTGISGPADNRSDKRCLTLSAVRNGELDLTASKPVHVSDSAARGNFIEPGRFYVVRGNGNRSLVGRGAFAPASLAMPVLYPDLLIEINADQNRLRSRYLRWVWDTPEVRADIEGRSMTTSGIYKINLANLSEVAIPLPSPDGQERIASLLDRRMSAVSRLRRTLIGQHDAIDRLQASILRRAFHREP